MQWGEKKRGRGGERERGEKKNKFFFFPFFPTPHPSPLPFLRKTKPFYLFILYFQCLRTTAKHTASISVVVWPKKSRRTHFPPPFLPSFFLTLAGKKKGGGGGGKGFWVTSLLAFSHKGQDWCWHVCKSMTSKCPPFSSPSEKFPFPPPALFPSKKKEEGGERREKKKGK